MLYQSCKNYSGEIEAYRYIICEMLGICISDFYKKLNDEIDDSKVKSIQKAIEQYRTDKVPPQYIVGHTYFYGYRFLVNSSVLIPRKETEELVFHALKEANAHAYTKILDIGTGSGCIAVSIKKQKPSLEVIASDNDLDALEVAKKNALNLKADIHFLHMDVLEGFNQDVDMIISNPPYIDSSEIIDDMVRLYEPKNALYSPEKGLYHYKKILKDAKKVLKQNGVILLELAYDKAQEVKNEAYKYYKSVEIINDIQGKNRIAIIR